MTTLVIPPREGKAVSSGGFGAIFKISGDSSEGRFSIVEHPIDPGRMVHPHVHAHEDEFSYILEGEIGARVGDEVVQATTGSYVFKPRGLPHTFWNATTQPARLLELISPAGFEQYFAELADLLLGPCGLETTRLRFGPLVCPMTFRHPTLVARMAAAVDTLSGGRR